jgi:hypothetical protein
MLAQTHAGLYREGDGALSLAIASRILMHNAEELAQQPWMDSMLAPI